MSFQYTKPPSRVSHAKPHSSGRGWLMTLDCGHVVYQATLPSCVGAMVQCPGCKPSAPATEGCGGDATLDRMVQ